MDVVRYVCPFEGCEEHFGSTNGVRHHWLHAHKSCTLPPLVGSSLRAVYVLDNANNLKPFEPIHDALLPHDSPAVTDSQLISMMGLDETSSSFVDPNSAGKFGRACRFASFPSIQLEVPKENNWLSACSAYISQCTERIQRISVHEQLVLSDSDKTFVPVKNAADNYAYVLKSSRLLINDTTRRDDIASLVQFLDCIAASSRTATVENVHLLLLDCLTDPSPAQKNQSKLLSWMIWMYQKKTQFTCPNRMQHGLVHVKYAFKCAAWSHIVTLKHTKEDVSFVQCHFKNSDCVYQQLQHYKLMARGCFVYQKPQKIRWLDRGNLQAKTTGSKWVSLSISCLKTMIEDQCDVAEQHLFQLGVPLIVPADLEFVQDSDETPVAHGLWNMNPSLRINNLCSRHTPKSILDSDTSIGVALGMAVSYTGGGALRVPAILDISVAKVSGGATRSLRYQVAKRRCAIAYDRTKSEGLQGQASFAKTKKTMKFASERLTCLLLTVAIRLKPHVIIAAHHLHGERASLYHGAFLIAEDGLPMHEDRLRYLINRKIEAHLPGLSVASLRHVTEAISLKAVEAEVPSIDQNYQSDMRLTMIALSAHSEATSDERYAGDQFQIGGTSAYHINRFYEAARIFNAFIGLEIQSKSSSSQVSKLHDYNALWLWVKVHRAEVALLAETQLGCQSASLQLSPHNTHSEVLAVQIAEKYPVAASPIGMLQLTSPSQLSVDTSQTPPKCSLEEILLQDTLQTPPTQLPAPHFSPSSTPNFPVSGSPLPHSSAAFTLTSIQKDTLELLNGLQGLGDRLLIIQPCATGKSRYYLHFADQPKTLVVLAQPFVSLQQQTTADLLKEHCVTKVNDNSFLSAQTVQKGILLLCSYERLHSMVNVAKQAIQEGLKLVVCIDEVHVLLDSVTVQSGYRAFRSVWTFMASLLQFNYIFFAMSATVRPKHEALLAQELGLNAFSKIHRTSPRRPEVTLLKIVCQTKQAALMSLVDQNPQMILVMTKSAGAQLQDELKQRGVTSQFFHAGMGTAEKGEILSVLGIKCVIATTAFITGLNAFQLHNSVIWQFAYSFESVTQFMGRLARKRGTVGTCTFITYPQAIQAYQKGDSSSKEMSNALQSGMVLEDIVMNALHSDRGPLSGSCIQQPGIDALRQAVADLKWCENIAIRGLACFYCGTDVQHNTAKCPRVMNRCFKCGVPGHSRQSCTEDRIIPENFCCRCLLPLWTLYEDYKVHDGACGFGCKQPLSDVAKTMFSMSAEGIILPGVLPSGTRQEQWAWLFKGRIPGILSLFSALKEACTKSKKFRD